MMMDLTEYVILPGADYKAACDAVREKTGNPNGIKSGQLASEIRGIVPKLQEKTVAPSDTAQTIVPDAGFDGLSKVLVDAAAEGITVQTKFGRFTTADGSAVSVSCDFVPDVVFVEKKESYDGYKYVTAIPFALYPRGTRLSVPLWSTNRNCYIYDFFVWSTTSGFRVNMVEGYGDGFNSVSIGEVQFEYTAIKYTE